MALRCSTSGGSYPITVEYFQVLPGQAAHEGEAFVFAPVAQQRREPLDGGLLERELSVRARLQKLDVGVGRGGRANQPAVISGPFWLIVERAPKAVRASGR